MRWFACKLRSFCFVDRKFSGGVDYSLRLVLAESEEEALALALALTPEPEEYKNYLGETVRWEFDSVEDLEDLGTRELDNGVEAYSWTEHRAVDQDG